MRAFLLFTVLLSGCTLLKVEPTLGDSYECDIDLLAERLGELCLDVGQMELLLNSHGVSK